jgi:hypothetical protein
MSGNLDSNPVYSFEEAWLFLEKYGYIIVEIEPGMSVEIRAGFTKQDDRVKKIIRVIAGKEEIRLGAVSWNKGHELINTKLLHEKISGFIDTAYVGK